MAARAVAYLTDKGPTMSRLSRRSALLGLLGSGLGMALAGCDSSAVGTAPALPYDPDKSKSQEDSMKKAAEESIRAAAAAKKKR